MSEKTVRFKIFVLLLLPILLAVVVYFYDNKPTATYRKIEGNIFGTVYHITYQSDQDLQSDIVAQLNRFDASLSPFNPTSIISRINNNDTAVVVDEWFTTVFEESRRIYQLTEGAFDPTLSPLINAWGFGFKKQEEVTQQLIDSLLPLVGYNKLSLKNGKIIKQDRRMTLNFSAIAKGFASDVVADLLQRAGSVNYLVEIGGEIVAKGVNATGNPWRVGINKPVEGVGAAPEDIEEVLPLSNAALATSGNYRNFYLLHGKRVAHTLSPFTGYPVQHSLLSATVIAPRCITADALATAFMVIGLEKSIEIVKSQPNIEAYFIYSDEKGEMAIYSTMEIPTEK